MTAPKTNTGSIPLLGAFVYTPPPENTAKYSNSQFVHCDLVQGIEIAIAIGIGVDFIIDPGDFDPDDDPDPDELSHIENCCRK